jgi:hypothetical protein
MFVTLELLVNLFVIWLIANLVHFWFFKDRIGGGMFCLAEKWKKDEAEKEEKIQKIQNPKLAPKK